MTEQHKASPEQWAQIERYAATDLNDDYAACLLDIRARVEALEDAENYRQQDQDAERAAEPAPADAGDSEYTDAEWAEIQRWTKINDTTPAPAGSLVDRVAGAISTGRHSDARAAIREVAAWLREQRAYYDSNVGLAQTLEQEAEQ